MEHLVISDNNIISYSMQNIINETKGKKFTTGTITFATDNTRQTVTHNLGVIPTIFLLYPLIPTSEWQQGFTYGWRCWVVKDFGSLSEFAITGQVAKLSQTLEYSSTNQSKSFAVCSADLGNLTETTARTGYRSSAYRIPANVEFGWIAIE